MAKKDTWHPIKTQIGPQIEHKEYYSWFMGSCDRCLINTSFKQLEE